MKCQQCPQSFSDMKSLQIHTFLEHNRGPSEARNTGSPTVLNLSQQARHPSPSPDHHQQIPCQICGVKLPNQIIYQQVTKRTNMFVLSWQWIIFSICKLTPPSDPSSAISVMQASHPSSPWRLILGSTPSDTCINPYIKCDKILDQLFNTRKYNHQWEVACFFLYKSTNLFHFQVQLSTNTTFTCYIMLLKNIICQCLGCHKIIFWIN